MEVTMELEWWAVDFKTGQRFGAVQVQSKGKLQKFLSMGTDVTVSVLCSHDGVPKPGWDEATQPGRMLLVAVDAESRHIVWGGLVRRRTSTEGGWVQCSLDSIEKYFNRRYVTTAIDRVDKDVAQIAADLLAPIAAELVPLQVDAKMTGATVSVSYDADMYVRVGAILEELSKVSGGIEWTVDLEWTDAAHTQMRYIVRIGPRLGRGGAEAGGIDPTGWTPTQWTMPGSVQSFEYTEDFGEETGANDTIAYSSGEGESKPKSTRYEATDLLGSFARFQRRFQPAPSLKDTSTLDQFAEADHAATRLGYSQIKITANLDAAPLVNLDWWMGDDIDVALTCDRFPRRVGSDGFWEPGYTRRVRTIGWEIDLDARTIIPRIREVE